MNFQFSLIDHFAKEICEEMFSNTRSFFFSSKIFDDIQSYSERKSENIFFPFLHFVFLRLSILFT